jgi:hypothetical protein
VGSAFIDQAGGDVARTAINIFSTGDKPALIVGIVIISLPNVANITVRASLLTPPSLFVSL